MGRPQKVENMKYKIYHTTLPSVAIENLVDPFDDPEKAQIHIDKLNQSVGFFNRLEESILAQGFRYPLLVIARDNVDFVRAVGGSRLWVAKKHNLDVPCIISDFDGRYKHLKPIPPNPKEIHKYFPKSQRVTLGQNGVWVQSLPHIHLGDKDYNDRKKWKV